MGIISGRIDAYLDKYMAMHISEWNLSKCDDINDIEKRLRDVTKDVGEISSYSVEATKKINKLNDRVKKLKTKRVM